MIARERSEFALPELRYHPINRVVALVSRLGPESCRRSLMAVVWRLEGGQHRSGTTRRLLRDCHGVNVGAFSYGSLLVPGMAQAGITIGRYVSIGPNMRRYNTHHPIDAALLHPYWYNPILRFSGPCHDMPRTAIVIDDDSRISANVVILPGCTRIGVGAVVGAGAIVTRDVEDFAVVMGVPGKEKSKRLSPALREPLPAAGQAGPPPTECEEILESIALDRA